MKEEWDLNGKSKDNLDLTDLHILQAVQQNARASYREIGAQVGLTGPLLQNVFTLGRSRRY
jgi:DNA-binding Lrp family transcriptional regulator